MDLGDVFSVLFIASVKAQSMRMWYELHHGLQLGNATFLTVSSSRVPSDRGHSEPSGCYLRLPIMENILPWLYDEYIIIFMYYIPFYLNDNNVLSDSIPSQNLFLLHQ